MELIKIQENDKGQKLVSAKDLYLFLGYDKSQWSRWYKKNIIENQFCFENEDWVSIDIVSNGNETKDFVLTLDFAKRISMMAKTEKGEEVRKYFIECEKQLKNQLTSINKYENALMLLGVSPELVKGIAKVYEEKDNLQIELDKSHEWLTIKKVAHANNLNWKSLEWKKLKDVSIATGYLPKKIFDANFPDGVNAYHVSVWKIVYPNLKY